MLSQGLGRGAPYPRTSVPRWDSAQVEKKSLAPQGGHGSGGAVQHGKNPENSWTKTFTNLFEAKELGKYVYFVNIYIERYIFIFVNM